MQARKKKSVQRQREEKEARQKEEEEETEREQKEKEAEEEEKKKAVTEGDKKINYVTISRSRLKEIIHEEIQNTLEEQR